MTKDLVIENINTTRQLGIAIQRLRKQKRMSQAILAKMMDMRQSTISDIENGRGTLESLFKIIQSLKINLSVSSCSLQKTKGRKSKVNELVELMYG